MTTMGYLPKLLGFTEDEHDQGDWKELRDVMLERQHSLTPLGGTVGALDEEYVKRRAVLVEWMTQVTEDALKLAPLTKHMAVAYLDKAVLKLGGQYINPSRLQLMATACVLSAAKMEENFGEVPSVQELNHCCQYGYSPQLIVKMESLLLDLLGWNLLVLTPRHFLDLYDGGGALVVRPLEEFVENNTIPTDKVAVVQRYQRQFANFFVDLCLQEADFVYFRPSVVAAAALASARRQLKMTPIWPHRLAKLTRHDFEQIGQCADHVWRVYERTFGAGSI